MIKEAIEKIVTREDLTYDEAYRVMNEIMSGKASDIQKSAYCLSFGKLHFLFSA